MGSFGTKEKIEILRQQLKELEIAEALEASDVMSKIVAELIIKMHNTQRNIGLSLSGGADVISIFDIDNGCESIAFVKYKNGDSYNIDGLVDLIKTIRSIQ